MSRTFRFSVAVSVLALSGCGRKTEPTPTRPSQPAPAAEAQPATLAKPDAPRASSVPENVPLAPVTPFPGELPIIAKARAYLGTEAKLNSITTLHYVGTLVSKNPADPKKESRATIEIMFDKPDRQRVTITSSSTKETTALNGYEAWMRITAATDPTKWQQTLLGVDGVKRLRATTWENVAFFRGIEQDGGRVADEGPVMIGDVPCEKVAFIHAPNIIYYRYFDRNTGRVVLSATEGGNTIKEQGDIIVDGMRFPKSIVTVSKNPAGQSQTDTITFDRITVNEPLPENTFSVPSLKVK